MTKRINLRPVPVAEENSFNAVRLLAALQVVYFHAYAHLYLPPLPGHQILAQFPGVPIFFAVSGFLVINSALKSKSVGHYALHRIGRIYPGLIVNIALLEVLVLATGSVDYSHTGPSRVFGYEAIYIVTASEGIAREFMSGGFGIRHWNAFFPFYPSGVLWTLTVELSFYAIVPLMVLVVKRKFPLALLVVVLAAASIAYTVLVAPNANTFSDYVVSVSVIPYFWLFAIGVLFRLFMPPVSWSTFFVPIILAVFMAVAYSHGFNWLQWKYFPNPVELVQSTLLALLALFVGVSPWMKSETLRRYDISYGVYLYHMLVVATFAGLGLPNNSWLLVPVYMLAAGLGLMSWLLVERPANEFVKRLRSRRTCASLSHSTIQERR